MLAPNPTTANKDLWGDFIARQWGPWIEPLWGKEAVDALAENVSVFVTAVMGGGIARMYADNAPTVSSFVEETHATAVPTSPDPALPSRLVAPPAYTDEVPPWMTHDPAAVALPMDVGVLAALGAA